MGSKIRITVGGIETTAGWDDFDSDLGAIVSAQKNKIALAPSQIAMMKRRLTALQQAQQGGAAIPKLMFSLGKKNVALADSLAKSLLNRRANKRADAIDRPSVPIGCPIDNLATVTLGPTVTVVAPHNGQPWRFMGFEANIATYGVRLASFKVAGLEQIAPAPPTYSASTPTSIGPDLRTFSELKVSRNATIWQPWGLDIDGILSSNATITHAEYNATLVSQSFSTTFYVQSFPCGDQAKLRPEFQHSFESDETRAFGARLQFRQRGLLAALNG